MIALDERQFAHADARGRGVEDALALGVDPAGRVQHIAQGRRGEVRAGLARSVRGYAFGSLRSFWTTPTRPFTLRAVRLKMMAG